MEKTCRKCGNKMSLESFHKNKNLKDGHHSICKDCKNKYDKIYRDRESYRQKERWRAGKRRKEDLKYKFLNAMAQAHTRGIEVGIKYEDIEFNDTCPLLEIPLNLNSSSRWDKPSFDRIDSSKGYVDGNVWVISVLANTMKSVATKEQLITFSKNILKYKNKL